MLTQAFKAFKQPPDMDVNRYAARKSELWRSSLFGADPEAEHLFTTYKAEFVAGLCNKAVQRLVTIDGADNMKKLHAAAIVATGKVRDLCNLGLESGHQPGLVYFHETLPDKHQNINQKTFQDNSKYMDLGAFDDMSIQYDVLQEEEDTYDADREEQDQDPWQEFDEEQVILTLGALAEKKTRVCYNCQDPGHFIANCPKSRRTGLIPGRGRSIRENNFYFQGNSQQFQTRNNFQPTAGPQQARPIYKQAGRQYNRQPGRPTNSDNYQVKRYPIKLNVIDTQEEEEDFLSGNE
jgi:hypothetical protein